MSIYDPLLKPILDAAKVHEDKILRGDFKDFTEAKVLVHSRLSLLRAVEIIKERAKTDIDGDGD